MKIQKRTIGLIIYFTLLLLPIYWMLNMSLRTNSDILRVLSFYPQDPTLENYIKIFTDRSWYSGYLNSIYYVTMNVAISWSPRCRPPTLFHAIGSSGTNNCFSGC